MNKHNLISLVLPTYNRSNRLGNAITSCLTQTFQNWELIIVDDGSVDDTQEVIQSFQFQDKNRIINRKITHVGLPEALNTGFNQAKGAYWSWLSDDTSFHPHALEALVHAFDTANGNHFGCVYADYWRIDERINRRQLIHLEDPPNFIDGNPIGPCFLYKRTIAEQIGPYEPKRFLAEDYDYWVRMSQKTKFKRIPVPLMNYHVHYQSLTVRYPHAIQKQSNLVRKRLKHNP